VVEALLAGGADVNARSPGPCCRKPRHPSERVPDRTPCHRIDLPLPPAGIDLVLLPMMTGERKGGEALEAVTAKGRL